MAMDFGNFNSILGAFKKLLKIQNNGRATSLPPQLILVGVPKKSGLSATKIASRIIQRKSEAGLPVGVLPSGGVSPDEIMERIRMEELIKAVQEDMIITVAIPPGTTLQASGTSPSGPVVVIGSTITITKGYGQAQ